MSTNSLSEIRRGLKNVPVDDLSEMLLRMARYKKENKELLSYLLFDADDEPEYIRMAKEEIDQQFKTINKSSPYLAKKNLRKILNYTNQRIRYSGHKRTETELLIYYCNKFRREAPFRTHLMIKNIYLRQVVRIKKTILSLHEDLQFDYGEAVKLLE